MSKKRRTYSTDEKLSILKRHLVGGENISDLCDELNIHPNQFYKWQANLFKQEGSFSKGEGLNHSERRELKSLKEENAKLNNLLKEKENVIAEVTSEYVQLKKNFSEN